MAATLVVRSFHDATFTTFNDIDNGSARFKAADNDTVDANNPLVIPGAGSVYSYVKQWKLRITATPPSNTVNNVKFYSDGANGLNANGGGALSNKLWAKTVVPETGTATGTQTTTTLQDTSKTWTVNGFTNMVVELTGGTGSGQKRTIVSNTANTLTITPAWGTTPVAASTTYKIEYIDPLTQLQVQVTGMTDVFTYTSGSPLSVTGSGTTANTDVSNFIVLQYEITSAAAQGTSNSETLTVQYDES